MDLILGTILDKSGFIFLWRKVHFITSFFCKNIREETDDICAINDGGEFKRSICEMYRKDI